MIDFPCLLTFQKELQLCSKEIPAVCHIHVTDENAQHTSADNWKVHGKRVSLQTLKTTVEDMETKETDCYICGPPSFIEQLEEYLVTLGFARTNIFYEKWW